MRARITRNQQRLDAGTGLNSKELVDLQSEIASLHRRQGVLEEAELDIMERLESVQGEASALATSRQAFETEMAEFTSRRDASLREIDTEQWATQASRDALVGSLPGPLVTLYEKLRAANGGSGAAELRQRRCSGCRLEINNVDLGTFRAAAPDQVLRCEECGRILIRTPESGLHVGPPA